LPVWVIVGPSGAALPKLQNHRVFLHAEEAAALCAQINHLRALDKKRPARVVEGTLTYGKAKR
jgi:hypothetical protein